MASDSKFNRLKRKLARKPGVRKPGGLAYHIGEEKYGKEGMERKAEAGRRRALRRRE